MSLSRLITVFLFSSPHVQEENINLKKQLESYKSSGQEKSKKFRFRRRSTSSEDSATGL